MNSPQERRANPRRPIKLAARLHLDGEHAWPCRITDFCAEGLFLRYSADSSRQLEALWDGTSPFEVEFREPDGRRVHRIPVRAVRQIDQAMGVMFTQPNLEAFQAMLRLCGAGEDLAEPHLRGRDNRARFILRQCVQRIVQRVEPLMPDFFQRLEQQLGEQARKATSDQQANQLMDAAMQLKARQRPFWHQMLEIMKAPLGGEKGAGKQSDDQSLSLVDKAEFEDWLLVRVLTTKAETQYRGPLLELKMRLEHAGVSNETGHANALGPALICDAFSRALSALRLGRDAERIAFRVFEVVVIRELGGLYESLNEILVRQGVLPDLDLSRYLAAEEKREDRSSRKKRQAGTAQQRERPAREPDSTEAGEGGDAEGAGTPGPGEGAEKGAGPDSTARFQGYQREAESAFSTVRNLIGALQKTRGGAIPDAEPAPEGPPLSPTELGQTLSELQRESVSGVDAGPPLRKRIFSRLRELGERSLEPEQEASVDVVDRFFGSIEDSARLSEAARQQIQQLQVPVLRVVLDEPGFFEDQGSPVRAVLNRIAELGMRGVRTNPAAQRRVDELVERIRRDFEQDTQVFEDALGKLDELIERQNLVYRRNVERVTAAAEGQQKVQEARREVTRELERRLGGRDVPRALVSLVNGGWRDLLSLTYIRQGPESAAYQDYLAVVDTLLTFAEDRNTPVNLPDLLRLIQEGLATISSNHMPSGHIRDELKQFLVAGADTPVEAVRMPERLDSEAQDEARALSEARNRRLQRWMSRAQRLETGTWVRHQPSRQETQHMRLVWIGRGASRFVFVNHQGMRVVERDLITLARELQQGIMVPDPGYDRPIVDEGVDRMVQQVYDQMSWVSTHDELTGLLTRREFERQLAHTLDRDGADGSHCLLLLDLRQFRLLNDTAGYEAGDETLRQVANLLRSSAGEAQHIARMGGTSFGLLFPADGVDEVGDRLVHLIDALTLRFSGRSYRLSSSVGEALSSPALATAAQWLGAAEEALEEAKQSGPGRRVRYRIDEARQSQQTQIAARVAAMESLDSSRLLLRCQRIIPLQPETRMGLQHEILISLYDSEGRVISAAEFVRMAEHYQRMQAVDRWVVGYMLDWLGRYPQALERLGGLCINLSGHSLNDEDLLEFIYDKLSRQDAPIERIWFEITEAAAIHNLNEVAGFIEGLQELGCRFCLGNFGAGPTAYRFLKELPVDLIKIDGAFIRDLARSSLDQAMVRSMTEMAHFTGREVIASQVEEKAALELLRELGVDYAQGYCVEKPKLLESF